MRYLFEHRDEAVWEPGVEVARLLIAATSHLETRLGIPCGFTEYRSDTVDIQPGQLQRFLQRFLMDLREWANLENTSIALLIRPVFVHLMSLLYCTITSVD
jgi:hypothetical protein